MLTFLGFCSLLAASFYAWYDTCRKRRNRGLLILTHLESRHPCGEYYFRGFKYPVTEGGKAPCPFYGYTTVRNEGMEGACVINYNDWHHTFTFCEPALASELKFVSSLLPLGDSEFKLIKVEPTPAPKEIKV